MSQQKEDPTFWTEEHSWGDFPFDKPYLNLSPMGFYKRSNNQNLKEATSILRAFVKELFTFKTPETKVRYPLI